MACTITKDHPQTSFVNTKIDPESFWGHRYKLAAQNMLLAQLDQLKETGRYDAFKLGWHEIYGKPGTAPSGNIQNDIPPSLFWESDVAKWMEAACYFLHDKDFAQSDIGKKCQQAIDELVDMICTAQQPDGYINIWFVVVKPDERWSNLRDLHELYNAGHLIEAALAHFNLTGDKKFLDAIVRMVDYFTTVFGPGKKLGYPGHPEIELALLRLYAVTQNKAHYDLAEFFLRERGTRRQELDGLRYFEWERLQRKDERTPHYMKVLDAIWYNQADEPILEATKIKGHSVRANYLLTAAADLGQDFVTACERLWKNQCHTKMYVTGGVGSMRQWEGFPERDYILPPSEDEGGCYAETCASIGLCMFSERMLKHDLNNAYTDVMELTLYNAIVGGSNAKGDEFNYENQLGSSDTHLCKRYPFFEVSCCPMNLSRTLGMLGGYAYEAKHVGRDENGAERVKVVVRLLISGQVKLNVENVGSVELDIKSQQPWEENTSFILKNSNPSTIKVDLYVCVPSWALDSHKFNTQPDTIEKGVARFSNIENTISLTTPMTPRVLQQHPLTGQDFVSVARGPLIYCLEDVDNQGLSKSDPHFRRVALNVDAKFELGQTQIPDVGSVITMSTKDGAVIKQDDSLYSKAQKDIYQDLPESLTFIPFFARANRSGGNGGMRVPFWRR